MDPHIFDITADRHHRLDSVDKNGEPRHNRGIDDSSMIYCGVSLEPLVAVQATEPSKPPMEIVPASRGSSVECEQILRSLPAWFGIESSLLKYAADTEVHPTLLARQSSALVGFITVCQHFEQSFEIHCVAVRSSQRRKGIGTALLQEAESWCRSRGCKFLQVKTISTGHPSPEYAETRAFYLGAGYVPLEEFPLLWSTSNPCLQLVKAL